jgi:hypothetical protein
VDEQLVNDIEKFLRQEGEDNEELHYQVKLHLFYHLLQQQDYERELGEFMSDAYLEKPWLAFRGGSDEIPPNYAQDCLDLFKKDSAAEHTFGIPGSAVTIRYQEGNGVFQIGAEQVPVSAIAQIVQFLRSLPISITPPPLTGAAGANTTQAPTLAQQRKAMEDKYFGRRR